LSSTNSTSEKHLLGVFDFLFEGGRDDDLWPQGELYRFGLCWSLPFSGDRLATKEVSTNPTVCRRFDVSNLKEKDKNINQSFSIQELTNILRYSASESASHQHICAILLKSRFMLIICTRQIV